MHKNESDIVPLNRDTVHRICSGQVVLSLAIAVKELIENSIDASATNIEIRLKNYGSESIEVIDNGTGVQQENYQSVTLKHYTSKLREFGDLEDIQTLGFRGEALSSLCALSKLTIITRHKSVDYATKIEYDSSGKIIKQIPAAREVGTTTILENVFESLPVRRKEFIKNLKREYGKMCQLLYAYCLVCKGVKFTCINRTKQESRNVIVATEGSTLIRDNIISVFGIKQLHSLVGVQLTLPDEKILEDFTIKSYDPDFCTFELMISTAIHGSGRSSSDRQFLYINSRPFESSKVAKLINETYRLFNPHQYPFVFLNVTMKRESVDINVTPDKRQIFIEKEILLLAVLKSSLLVAFKDCPSTLQMQNVETRGKKRPNEENEPEMNTKRLAPLHDESKVKLDQLISMALEISSQTNTNQLQQSTLESFVEVKTKSELDDEVELEPEEQAEKKEVERRTVENKHASNRVNEKVSLRETANEEFSIETSSTPEKVNKATLNCIELNTAEITEKNESNHSRHQKKLDIIKKDSSPNKTDAEITKLNKSFKKDICNVTVRCSIDYIKTALKACENSKQNQNNEVKVLFRSEITPSSNKTAEQELQKQVTKDMFKSMEIIGQFNLGFIVTKFKDDLFIIDQHASDEKYNFEQLQLTTVLERQVLVRPKPLELTSGNEELLIENIEMFRKNGFNFDIHHNAPATKKIFMSAIPMSKNYIFGKDDIEEMLFMLQADVQSAACRPSRIRGMFASRACRKSVMIGHPLTSQDMRRIVDHMSEIDQPWNCPHGRPTMRHLINLKLIESD